MAIANYYDHVTYETGRNNFNMPGSVNDYRCMLMTNGHSFNRAHTARTDVAANQIPSGNGYTQATGGGTGTALTSVTWGPPVLNIATFDSADVVWTATGGSIDAYHLVIFFDPNPNDLLLCSIDFEGLQSAGDGTDFRIVVDAAGWFDFG